MADVVPSPEIVEGALRPQLLTYPDSLGGTLSDVRALLRGPLDGLFGGVHVLPPYPSTGDRGFAPITYDEIDPRFGTWADIEDLARSHAVLLDLMVNHISRHSPEFQAFARDGRHSPAAELFITPDKIWPDGPPPIDDIARLFLRRRAGPFSKFVAGDGSELTVWTTFGEAEPSEQIDLDLTTAAARDLVIRTLTSLASHGVSMVRLDAVGYVVKKPGTSSFMVAPEIYEFLDWITGIASKLGLVLLPEIHASGATHDRITASGYWSYDFVLPGLLLHSIATGDTTRLIAHLASSPTMQVTMLDCHDGIPVRPDLEGILASGEMRRLADLALERGGNINRILSPFHAIDGVDVHQLNLTYFAAVGEDEDRYILARAIQLFARGIPQVYYVGLLVGSNDTTTDDFQSRDGRAINRHNYSLREVEESLRRPVVQRLISLVRLRNQHPAFAGQLSVSGSGSSLQMRWVHHDAVCELEGDLTRGSCVVRATGPDGVLREAA